MGAVLVITGLLFLGLDQWFRAGCSMYFGARRIEEWVTSRTSGGDPAARAQVAG
jgi:hypothetical protein